MASRVYLPSLDGIRAVCILLVVGAHASHRDGFPSSWIRPSAYVFDGQLGVTVFFVLSGFLITYLLAREEQRNGAISLKAFYVRRILRIFPVYYVFLLVLLVLTFITGLSINGARWLSAVTFTKNYGASGWIDGHLWSLSVEEQFYLLWPFVFAFATRRGRFAFAGALILSAPLFRAYLYRANYGFYLFSFMTNMDALMIGSVVGLAFQRHPEQMRAIFAWRPALGRVLAVLAIYAIWIPRANLRMAVLTVLIGNTVQSVAAAYLIASYASIKGGLIYQLLNLRVVRYIGILSYSLYIWQQLFLSEPGIFGAKSNVFLAFPINVLSAFAVSALSYHLLEMPLAGLRKYFRMV